MDKNRILELAMETLERQKAEIDAEILKLRSEMRAIGSVRTTNSKSQAKPKNKRTMSLARRKALSEKMTKYWAEKKGKKLAKKK
jgi:hypothetical protein